MSRLELYLKFKSYLIDNDISVADVVVYHFMQSQKNNLVKFPEILRWFNHINALVDLDNLYNLDENDLTILPLIKLKESNVNHKNNSTDQLAVKQVSEDKNKQIDSNTKQIPEVKGKTSSVPKEKKTSVDSIVSTSKESKNEASESIDLSPALLDIRVGIITRCWEHPDSDKLLCEEIDVGESTGPRQIASGIKSFYSANEMQGKKVLVLCNLKERSLAGFKSQV